MVTTVPKDTDNSSEYQTQAAKLVTYDHINTSNNPDYVGCHILCNYTILGIYDEVPQLGMAVTLLFTDSR